MNLQNRSLSSTTMEKFKGALVFSAIGDAMGWPTEFGRYPTEVAKRFGKRYLEGYIPWQKMVGGKFWGYREVIKEGEYSDDTQLTLAVYRCIDESGNFNPDKFAYFELPLWLHYERGGGKTIKTSARKLHKSLKEWMNNFYMTKDLSYRNAGANGAAMRVLPIALVNLNNKKRLYRDTFINSIITHGHPRAILGSTIYASAVNFLAEEKEVSKETFLKYLHETINSFSGSFKGDDFVQKWINEWDKKPLNGMQFKEVFQKTRNEAIGYLNEIKEKISSDDKEFYKLTGALNKEYKGSGISTVLVSLYLFLKYFDNPQKAILKAVNTLGSDTDTIAAFVGGLFGAHYGFSAIPMKFLYELQDKEYILRIATDLYNIVIGEAAKRHVSSKTFERYDAYLKIMAWEIGLHEMFWDALHEGEAIIHPVLGKGVIKGKRIEPLRREDYQVKLIGVSFDCGQTCVFHSRVSKDGELSESLAKDTKKTLESLRKEEKIRATPVSPISISPFEDVVRIYEIPTNQRDVKRFLLTHNYLINTLFEANRQIRRVFGENIVEVCLDYDRDPEEDFEGLSVIVKTNLTPELSLDLLDKLDEEWWLDVDDEIRMILSIMVRPV